MVEPSASLPPLAHFWKAAVDFFPSFDDVYEGVEERSEIGKQRVGAGDEAEGRRNAVSEGDSSFLPRFMRGFGFRDNAEPLHSRTASFTEFDDPLPNPR